MKHLTIVVACVASMLATPALAQTKKPAAPAAATSLSAETRAKLMASLDRATSYLVAQQKPDGNFENHAGIAALAASALVRQPGPGKETSRPTVNRTLDYLRTLAKPDGGIYQKDIPHYVTAVAVMALVAGGRPEDQPLVANAKTYLASRLLDEGEGVTRDNKFYGGMGYGGTGYAGTSDGMADIVSLEYGLRALKDAGMDDKDPAWRRAIEFLQRTQNLKETNDQKWAGNDGGFVYYPGRSMASETASYGAGTYAGLLSYSWANLSKLDPRVQATLKWVRNNYTVDENPGVGQRTVYYYYMVFAKALQAVGEDVIVDAKGVGHNWREDLGRKLLALQKPEGYWVNTDPSEMQNNKVLVTAFTMQAIEAILQ